MGTDLPPMEETGPTVSEDDVRAFEAQLGTALPEDYRAFVLGPNGGRTASTHDAFRAGRAGQVTLNDLFGLHDPNPGCQLEEGTPYWVPKELIAIGSASGGMVALCIRGEHRGSVWYLDTLDARPDDANPRVQWHDRHDYIKVADSFGAFMAGLGPS
jgi:hypothetical protein